MKKISVREGVEILRDTLLLIRLAGGRAVSVVPLERVGSHDKYIRKYRGDCVTAEGLNITHVKAFMFEKQDKDVLYYREEGTGEIRTIKVDREVTHELEYGFLSSSRLSGLWGYDADIERARIAIEENEWIFAKSMPENPHWYALRRDWRNETLEFDDFAELIRREGCDQQYWRRIYRVMEIGDHFYWSMGAPMAITVLINRKEL